MTRCILSLNIFYLYLEFVSQEGFPCMQQNHTMIILNLATGGGVFRATRKQLSYTLKLELFRL